MASGITLYKDILDAGNVTIADTGAYIDTGLSIEATISNGQTIVVSSWGVVFCPASTRVGFLIRIFDGTQDRRATYWNDFNAVLHRRSFQAEWIGKVGTDIDAGTYTFKTQCRSVNGSSHDVAGTGDFFSKMAVVVYD